MMNISINSKKIKKQYIPKKRLKPKQEIAALLLKVPQKYVPDGIEDPNIDDRERRRLMQKFKNRLASQRTRDQRKQHISELEEVSILLEMANKELNEKNRLLNERNKELEERLKAVENEKLMLLEENGKLKQTKENEKFIDDPQDYFDLSGDKHEEDRFSPKLTRKQNPSQSHYFNCLMGIIMMCTIYTSAGIQIQPELSEYNMVVESTARVSEPLSAQQNERIFMEPEAIEALPFEVNLQKIKANADETKNFYYCRSSGLGPLRSTKDNDNKRDLFDKAHFRRFVKRTVTASLLLINFSRDLRVMVIILLISLLLCSFVALDQSIQCQTLRTLSPLKMISGKEAELRKERIRELESKASAWKSQFQFYCEDIESDEIFDKSF